MKDFFTYYEILEVEETADLEGIKRAYRSKALQYHPDRVPDHLKKRGEEIFKRISEAYEVLSDPRKRKQYDEELKNLKTDQPFNQTDSSENPVLEVDKTRFEFKDVAWGTTVSDSILVSNAGGGVLTGTIKSVCGWIVFSEDVIDTPYVQEIKITIDTTILLANQQYREEIEIQTNGGDKTVYVDFSTAPRSSMDTVIFLARSIVSKRWFMPLFYTISLMFVSSLFLFLGDLISNCGRSPRERIGMASLETRQEIEEAPRKFPPKSGNVWGDWHESVPQTAESKPPVEDIAVYQTLFNKRGPVGYAPVVTERRDAAGNVSERRVEYLRKEKMESILADNEEQKIYYPATGAFYPIDKSRYPEFYKKCDLDGDGVITLYELGETQEKFSKITAKYPEGDVDSIVREFVK